MTDAASSPSGPHRDERWLWLFFAAAWCLHFHFSLAGWDASLLNRFQFRQVQTAIATLFFPSAGFPLAYELPLFGPPWTVPLEFPLYQATVGWFARFTGLALEPAGRAVSWLYFQSALPALYLLLGSVGVTRPLRWITLALLVTSPLYLFFSRCFLIESLALSAGLWFLAAFARWLDRPRWGWLALCILAGAVAAVVKITTWVVFAFAAALWTLARARSAAPGAALKAGPLLRGTAALLPGLVAGLAWTLYAKAVRDLNPDTAILNTLFGHWTFGDVTQRFTWNYWHRTTEVWINGVLSDAGLATGLLLFVRLAPERRSVVLAAFATFLSGQLIFSNLYMVHDYYFYASGVFLIGALGIAVANFFASEGPRWLRWTLPAVLVAGQLASYGRTYLPEQRVGHAPQEYIQAVRDLTDPDDLIVVLGQDWDAGTPLYAERRALMLTAGRERDPAGIRRSVARLDPAQVGAVLIFGHLRTDADFAQEAMAPLDLGSAPLLINHSAQVGIWIPQVRLAAAIDRMPTRPYATLDFVDTRATRGESVTMGQRAIARRREFLNMDPKPIRATITGSISEVYVGQQTVVNAHAPFELEFRPASGARRLEAVIGIQDGAFQDPHRHTDGVTFEVILRRPDGTDVRLHGIHLDPYSYPLHRGPQRLEAALPAAPGTILLRAHPGPAGNASFDWSYVGAIEIR